MKAIEKPWLETGYRNFAYDGPGNLKIERVAKEVNKNKSSFYHLFASMEIFMERLLDFHIEQAKVIAQKEADANEEQQLITIFIEHKVDLLFNRQLRFHRSNPVFATCFNRVNTFTFPAIMPVWKKIIGLTDDSALAEMVLALSIENFYLQITDETLSEDWLKSYFKTIRGMVYRFKISSPSITLDGAV